MIIKPSALKKGDLVGLIAPSSPAPREKLDGAIRILEEIGLQVRVGQTCTATHGYLSGTDELRAGEMNEMFQDPEIKGIVCLRGGYGTPRILDRIDYEKIRENPKIFIGFSDITAVHTAIQNRTGLITFHGPMGAIMGAPDFTDYSKKSWVDMLFGITGAEELFNPPGEELIGVQGGVASGRLCGGNLSLIADTMGTPYEIDTKGKILFIEEIGEAPRQIDRMMTELRLAGKLDDAAGIIYGDWCDCVEKERSETLSLEYVLNDFLPPGKPVLMNLRAGHCEPQMTLPMNGLVEINGERGAFRLLEKPTKE